MEMVKFHGDMDLEKFWIQWFGPLGRELGTNKFPHRNWTDNPDDLLEFIKMCAIEHEDGELCRPCWISAQPMQYIRTIKKYGSIRHIGKTCAIEKLFFDFDDDTKYCKNCDEYIKKDDFRPIKGKRGSFCPKCGTECHEKPRKDVVGEEVKKFVKNIPQEVFIVETRKGFHVYIFLCQIFEFEKRDFQFAKEVYKLLQERYITKEYEFIDQRIIGDLMRFARVPLTAHEKTGEVCKVLDRNLKQTKIRNLEFYRTYGIRPSIIKSAIKTIRKRKHKAHQEANQIMEDIEKGYLDNGNGFQGTIRPCFKKRMEIGEMCHAQRLAWLSEIYHAGFNTKTKMVELCRKTWSDFNERISIQQIEDYFKHQRWKWKPYRCSTIIEKGWCLESDCPIWMAKHKKDYKSRH